MVDECILNITKEDCTSVRLASEAGNVSALKEIEQQFKGKERGKMNRTSTPTSLAPYIRIKHGFAFQSEHFGQTGEYLLLTPGNFYEAGGFRSLGDAQKRYSGQVPSDYILKEGDVLVAMTEQSPGLLGATIRIPKGNTYLHNQRLGLVEVVRPDLITKEYVYHFFNAPHIRKEISATASGTKVKHTSPDKLLEVSISLPSIQQQKRVVSILDSWDAAIAKTEELLGAKEKNHRWLLQRLIELKAARNHWETQELGAVIRERSERSTQHDEYPVLTSSRRGMFLQSEYFSKQVTSEDNTGYKIMRRADFTFRSMSDDGRFVFNRLEKHDNGIISPAYGVFYADGVCPEFLAHYLNSSYFAQLLARETQGGTRKALRFSALAGMEVDLPKLADQERIAEMLDESRHEIGLLQSKLEMLRLQKRGLMQKLLTGKWGVPVAAVEVA